MITDGVARADEPQSHLRAQADLPPEGEMEGDSESEAQWDIASSNRTGIGNPQGHHEEMPGCRGSSNATVPGGSHGVII